MARGTALPPPAAGPQASQKCTFCALAGEHPLTPMPPAGGNWIRNIPRALPRQANPPLSALLRPHVSLTGKHGPHPNTRKQTPLTGRIYRNFNDSYWWTQIGQTVMKGGFGHRQADSPVLFLNIPAHKKREKRGKYFQIFTEKGRDAPVGDQ